MPLLSRADTDVTTAAAAAAAGEADGADAGSCCQLSVPSNNIASAADARLSDSSCSTDITVVSVQPIALLNVTRQTTHHYLINSARQTDMTDVVSGTL